jgi:hypothetical protein
MPRGGTPGLIVELQGIEQNPEVQGQALSGGTPMSTIKLGGPEQDPQI